MRLTASKAGHRFPVIHVWSGGKQSLVFSPHVNEQMFHLRVSCFNTIKLEYICIYIYSCNVVLLVFVRAIVFAERYRWKPQRRKKKLGAFEVSQMNILKGACVRVRGRDSEREGDVGIKLRVFARNSEKVSDKEGWKWAQSRRLEDQHQRQRRVKTMLCQKVIPDVFISFLMAIIFAYTSKKNLLIYEWVMYRIKNWHILHLSLWLPVTAFFWYLKCLYWTVMYFFQSLLSSCLSLSWKTHF